MNNRKWHVDYWIREKLKSALKCVKDGNNYVARMEIFTLRGMLQYMRGVGDIDKATYNKVYKLTVLIASKYDVY